MLLLRARTGATFMPKLDPLRITSFGRNGPAMGTMVPPHLRHSHHVGGATLTHEPAPAMPSTAEHRRRA